MTTPPMMLDLDASPIAGQIGWAVMDLDGQMIKSNSVKDKDISILFQMLQESAKIQGQQPLKRLTVTFPGVARFLVTRDESHIYMVQTTTV